MSRPGPAVSSSTLSKRLTIADSDFFIVNSAINRHKSSGRQTEAFVLPEPGVAGPVPLPYYDVRASAVVWRGGRSASVPMKRASVAKAMYPVAGR